MTEETKKVETQEEAVPELVPDPINFTDAAVNKVRALMEEEGNPNLKLRVFVQGGGCAGFQYGFTFDEEQNADDAVMEKGGENRLQGRSLGRTVRDRQSQRGDDLRLRLVLQRLTKNEAVRKRFGVPCGTPKSFLRFRFSAGRARRECARPARP